MSRESCKLASLQFDATSALVRSELGKSQMPSAIGNNRELWLIIGAAGFTVHNF
jgi:hypothetical protein